MSATVAPWNLEPISVTIAEATRLLGFKDSKTVYNLIYQGKIKAPQGRASISCLLRVPQKTH